MVPLPSVSVHSVPRIYGHLATLVDGAGVNTRSAAKLNRYTTPATSMEAGFHRPSNTKSHNDFSLSQWILRQLKGPKGSQIIIGCVNLGVGCLPWDRAPSHGMSLRDWKASP